MRCGLLGIGVLLLALGPAAGARAAECGGSGTEGILVTESAGSYTCRPDAAGLFPAVLYSHGGRDLAVGGDLQGTCEALARAGYLAYAKLRLDPEGKTIPDHLLEVDMALDHLLGETDADTNRVALIGYSRGGSLTYAIAESRASEVDATVVLAPAPAGNFFANQTADVSPLIAPMMVGVASNDLYQADHVGIAEALVAALEAEGKSYQYFPYPDYPDSGCVGCDGHQIFQVVDDEFTDYWCDVETFLALHLSSASAVPALGPTGLLLTALAFFASGVGALYRWGGSGPRA